MNKKGWKRQKSAQSTQKLVEIHNKQFLTFQFKGVYTQFEPVKEVFVIHDNLIDFLSLTKLLNPFKALEPLHFRT